MEESPEATAAALLDVLRERRPCSGVGEERAIYAGAGPPAGVTLALTPTLTAVLVAVVFVAGTINSVAGFGFALVGTMVLATVVDPATAVVFMIVPILSANLTLVQELSAGDLRTCGRRFAPLVGAALVGTVVGMVILDSLPAAPLRIGLGAVTLAFVATAQNLVPVPGIEGTRDRCFVESPAAMAGVGGVSGLLFGGVNVGVQLIAYLRSYDLSHGLFVGVVAMVFLGLNAVRVGVAGFLVMYPSLTVAAVSVGAAVPAIAGVTFGQRIRGRVGEGTRQAVVLGLLAVIGVRLVLGELGIA
jgi:uncharacterized membrane protein YfcA